MHHRLLTHTALGFLKGANGMAKMIEALEREIENLKARHRSEIQRGQRMLEEAIARDGDPSTHLGHNLGAVANEISELAAKIEQTQMILRDLKTRVEFAEGK
jgi:septal ring factor EnvC (AmiA/AmiB activator)